MAALIALGLSGLGVLLLLRPRHALFGGDTAPAFAAPALLCTAAGLVLANLALGGATAVPEPLRQAAEESAVIRVRVELAGTPRASRVADKFSEDSRGHTRYQVEARAGSMRSGETWLPADSPVTLGYGESLAPVGIRPTRGTRRGGAGPHHAGHRPGNAAAFGSLRSPRSWSWIPPGNQALPNKCAKNSASTPWCCRSPGGRCFRRWCTGIAADRARNSPTP